MSALSEGVAEFIEKATSSYGRVKQDEFRDFMFAECTQSESPIEQLFFVGLNLVAAFNAFDLSVGTAFVEKDLDLLVIPQWRAGKYRVDFAMRECPGGRVVCVELDGHEFHDRNEQQRRYEKARDRFLTAQGHAVLHFTGAEVFKDPCAAALEAFKLATQYSSAERPQDA